jgi:putative Mn2+ efflux pump MntP
VNFPALFFIALALALDTFAVSIAGGLSARRFTLRHALTLGIWFGGFQALMPFLGWAGGIRMRGLITGFDHWIAFGLLCFVGGKMIYESFKIKCVEDKPAIPEARVMFVLAVATSIDALAVGVSFAMIDIAIVFPVIVIGLVTFLMSVLGLWIGARGLHVFENKIEIAGGLILIGIGIKILVSHLCEAPGA